jgi:hypothetical protein
MAVVSPPAYAWDWLARQHVTWREIRNRLIATPPLRDSRTDPPGPSTRAVGDVPDWSSDIPDLTTHSRARGAVPGPTADRPSTRDYRTLDTRAEVLAALRTDYPMDPELRCTVDAAVAEVAFLGRLDVPLHELGVRSAPRGMRWWWSHLGGPMPEDDRSVIDRGAEHLPSPPKRLPTQLRLVDVLAGYGDVEAS